MKKRKFVIFSLLIVLLLSFSGFQYYRYQRVHNIFDEIYYEESDYHNYTFERFMWYYDDESTGYFQQSQIEAFLVEHGKTVDEIRKEADNVLRNKVLKDWTTIYSSRFSPDNWGEVTVKDIWRTE